MSPGVLLAVLLVLICAQVTRLLTPRRGNYLSALAAAAVGLLIGELIALSSGHGGPVVGAVHPVVDLVAIAGAEALVVILIPRRATARR